MERGIRIKAIAAAAVLILGMLSSGKTALANSNSITVDEIEYYMQTDKSVYDLAEDVEMLYRVTNVGEGDAAFWFPYSAEWNFWVEKDGQHVWKAVHGWYASITAFTLSPGEYKEYPYIWDMRDDEDILVSASEYSVIGGFDAGSPEDYEYSRVSVGVEIVPEPATFSLFAFGALTLRASYKQKILE